MKELMFNLPFFQKINALVVSLSDAQETLTGEPKLKTSVLGNHAEAVE